MPVTTGAARYAHYIGKLRTALGHHFIEDFEGGWHAEVVGRDVPIISVVVVGDRTPGGGVVVNVTGWTIDALVEWSATLANVTPEMVALVVREGAGIGVER